MTTSPADIPALSFSTLGKFEPVPMESPRPLSSIVASARRLTGKDLESSNGSRSKVVQHQDWQEDAWDMFDLVGEQRFLVTTLAGRLSQARFYVGTTPTSETDAPEPVEDTEIQGVLEAFGQTSSGRQQLMHRMSVNLSVAGDGWFVGMPPQLLPEKERPDEAEDGSGFTLEDTDAKDLAWRMLSVSEVSQGTLSDRTVRLRFGETEGEVVEVNPDDVYLIRVWRPHPRRSWQADSPTHASLAVLKELVNLTMKISAQVDSRLAGAGVFIVPQSAKTALLNALGLEPDSDEDPFTEALMEAMLTPIQDRASAAAVVPLVITSPDEAVDKFRHITFDKPMDGEDRPLREEAIRRLALGQDAPPEVLLGTAGMNHWGAWLVREDVVTTHLEPPLALICDALTTQYLWPVLESMGVDDYRQYVIWYDVSDLVTRPNRSQDAMVLHEREAISDSALRNATGFDEQDAPLEKTLDPAAIMVLRLIQQDPDLITSPGIDALMTAVRTLMATQNQTDVDPEDLPPADTGRREIMDPPSAVPTTDGEGTAIPGPDGL